MKLAENKENLIVDEATQEPDIKELLKIRRDKLSYLQENNKDPFEITVCPRDTYNKQIVENFEALENTDVCIAGRIMSWRDMGKACFMDVHDSTGRMQVYIKINDIGEDFYNELSKWDIGDIISVEGFVFKTRRGEISVHAKKMTLLSKSLCGFFIHKLPLSTTFRFFYVISLNFQPTEPIILLLFLFFKGVFKI